MVDYDNLCHSVWECKYHVVFIPKYRKKAPYGEIRRRMGDMFGRWPSRRSAKSWKAI